MHGIDVQNCFQNLPSAVLQTNLEAHWKLLVLHKPTMEETFGSLDLKNLVGL